MATNFEGISTADLVANIKQMLADRRAQFERDYPVTEKGRCIMSVYLLAFLAVVIPFMAGYYLGVSDGKVEGRAAMYDEVTNKIEDRIQAARAAQVKR